MKLNIGKINNYVSYCFSCINFLTFYNYDFLSKHKYVATNYFLNYHGIMYPEMSANLYINNSLLYISYAIATNKADFLFHFNVLLTEVIQLILPTVICIFICYAKENSFQISSLTVKSFLS